MVFMGYYNPVLNYGIEAYAKDCAAAGVDGFIIPDLPVDEAEPFHNACRAVGLALISMLAPTSTDDRIALGAASADGFVYCVSVAWAAERTREGRVEWMKEATGVMLADPLTKLMKADILYEAKILVDHSSDTTQ